MPNLKTIVDYTSEFLQELQKRDKNASATIYEHQVEPPGLWIVAIHLSNPLNEEVTIKNLNTLELITFLSKIGETEVPADWLSDWGCPTYIYSFIYLGELKIPTLYIIKANEQSYWEIESAKYDVIDFTLKLARM